MHLIILILHQKRYIASYNDWYQNIYMYTVGLGFIIYFDSDIEFVDVFDQLPADGFIIIPRYETSDASPYLQTVPGTDIYNAIEKANICIDNLPGSPIWEKEETADDARSLYTVKQ